MYIHLYTIITIHHKKYCNLECCTQESIQYCHLLLFYITSCTIQVKIKVFKFLLSLLHILGEHLKGLDYMYFPLYISNIFAASDCLQSCFVLAITFFSDCLNLCIVI